MSKSTVARLLCLSLCGLVLGMFAETALPQTISTFDPTGSIEVDPECETAGAAS